MSMLRYSIIHYNHVTDQWRYSQAISLPPRDLVGSTIDQFLSLSLLSLHLEFFLSRAKDIGYLLTYKMLLVPIPKTILDWFGLHKVSNKGRGEKMLFIK